MTNFRYQNWTKCSQPKLTKINLQIQQDDSNYHIAHKALQKEIVDQCEQIIKAQGLGKESPGTGTHTITTQVN